MYIFKNESGIELTIEEFMEIVENDLLPELITIVSHIDSTEFIEEFLAVEDDNEQIEKIYKRFISDE